MRDKRGAIICHLGAKIWSKLPYWTNLIFIWHRKNSQAKAVPFKADMLCDICLHGFNIRLLVKATLRIKLVATMIE